MIYEFVRASLLTAWFVFVFQGTNASALEKDIGPEQFPINEHYFGLVNVSIAAFSRASGGAARCQNNTGVIYQNTARRDSCPGQDAESCRGSDVFQASRPTC